MSTILHVALETGQAQRQELWRALFEQCTPRGPWIAGGAAQALFFERKNQNDIDVWFASRMQLEDFIQWLSDAGAVCTVEKERNARWLLNGIEFNLVTGVFFPTLEAVLESFDFRMCKFGTDGRDLYFDDHAPQDVKDLKMVLTLNQNLPFYTQARIHKYSQRGFVVQDPKSVLLTLAKAAYMELERRGETGGGS